MPNTDPKLIHALAAFAADLAGFVIMAGLFPLAIIVIALAFGGPQ